MLKVLAAKALAAEIPKKAKSPGNLARQSPRHARAFLCERLIVGAALAATIFGPKGPPTDSFVCFARKNQRCAFRL